MNYKSETQHLLESFITFESISGIYKTIHVDNELEFISMRNFFLKKVIECQRTCVYTPQQNEVVEHKHRHILNTTRALLFQSHLPLEFGECVLTDTYIINRLPTLLLKNKSAFEMLYNRPPSLSHLKTFGCLCYVTVFSPKQKFDPRAQQCIFICYPLNQKAYKLFDIDADTFFTSRDVIFHESVFPFCQQSQTQYSPPLQGILRNIDIDLLIHVQHSLDQPSSPTNHNAPEPPSNQPSSPTRHNAPEPPLNQHSSPTRHNAPEPPTDQPSSPTSRSLAPITKASPTDLPVR